MLVIRDERVTVANADLFNYLKCFLILDSSELNFFIGIGGHTKNLSQGSSDYFLCTKKKGSF